MLRGVSRQNWYSAVGCSAAAVLALGNYLQWNWRLIPAGIAFVLFGAIWFACKEHRTRRFAAAFGFLFSLLQLWGTFIYKHSTIAPELLALPVGIVASAEHKYRVSFA